MSAYSAKITEKPNSFSGRGGRDQPTDQGLLPGLADLAADRRKTMPRTFLHRSRFELAEGCRGKAKIAQFGKSKYTKYHGSDDGWNDVLPRRLRLHAPPISPLPSTCRRLRPTGRGACQEQESRGDEFCGVADGSFRRHSRRCGKGMDRAQGKPLQMVAHIISLDASGKATKLTLAGSSDDIDASGGYRSDHGSSDPEEGYAERGYGFPV